MFPGHHTIVEEKFQIIGYASAEGRGGCGCVGKRISAAEGGRGETGTTTQVTSGSAGGWEAFLSLYSQKASLLNLKMI
jgi:hypothetical protein